MNLSIHSRQLDNTLHSGRNICRCNNIPNFLSPEVEAPASKTLYNANWLQGA